MENSRNNSGFHFETSSGDEKAIGLPRGSASASFLTAEEAELAKLGYKQEFKREFSWISTFSFAFSISGLLATVGALLCAPRFNGVGYYNFWISVDSRRTPCSCMVLVCVFHTKFDMIGLLAEPLVCVLP